MSTPSLRAYSASSACSASMKAATPPRLLRLADHRQREGGLARRLRAEDLDHAAAREAADADRRVDRERAGGDELHRQDLARPEPHDRALAELPLDLRQGAFDRLEPLRFHVRHESGPFSSAPVRFPSLLRRYTTPSRGGSIGPRRSGPAHQIKDGIRCCRLAPPRRSPRAWPPCRGSSCAPGSRSRATPRCASAGRRSGWWRSDRSAALAALVAWVQEHGEPFHLLGLGSNVLMPDEGLPGVVARLGGELKRVRLRGRRVSAGAAAPLAAGGAQGGEGRPRRPRSALRLPFDRGRRGVHERRLLRHRDQATCCTRRGWWSSTAGAAG